MPDVRKIHFGMYKFFQVPGKPPMLWFKLFGTEIDMVATWILQRKFVLYPYDIPISVRYPYDIRAISEA